MAAGRRANNHCLMPREKLKMNHEDVCTAIKETFCRQIGELEFERNLKFTEIDRESNRLFQLSEKFEGCGEYLFTGEVGLFTENNNIISSAHYDVSGKVIITEIDGSPSVEFIGMIGARKLLK